MGAGGYKASEDKSGVQRIMGEKAIVQVTEKVPDENLKSMIALHDSCMQCCSHVCVKSWL